MQFGSRTVHSFHRRIGVKYEAIGEEEEEGGERGTRTSLEEGFHCQLVVVANLPPRQ